jgi:hypothetical protein
VRPERESPRRLDPDAAKIVGLRQAAAAASGSRIHQCAAAAYQSARNCEAMAAATASRPARPREELYGPSKKEATSRPALHRGGRPASAGA